MYQNLTLDLITLDGKIPTFIPEYDFPSEPTPFRGSVKFLVNIPIIAKSRLPDIAIEFKVFETLLKRRELNQLLVGAVHHLIPIAFILIICRLASIEPHRVERLGVNLLGSLLRLNSVGLSFKELVLMTKFLGLELGLLRAETKIVNYQLGRGSARLKLLFSKVHSRCYELILPSFW